MDIRDKNKYFDLRSPKLYASEYFYQILESSKMVDLSDLEEIIKVIRDAEKNKIYSIGHGGSESISQHFITDFTKGTNNKNFKIKTFNLSSNSSMITALGNDFGFNQIYSKQIEYYCSEGDILLSISSSGNSANIIDAIKAAKSLGIKTISFTGFSGGEVKNISDLNLHVPFDNYGIVEDMHQSFMHIIAQYLFKNS